MPSLLSLPRELRDDIWERACQSSFPPNQFPRHNGFSRSLLQTNRQIYHEAAPYMYETSVINLSHPQEVLQWLQSIGISNSSCIYHLVLKFTSLSVDHPLDEQVARNIWSVSLQLLPNLQSLSFNYTPKDVKVPSAGSHEEAVVSPTSPIGPCQELPTLLKPETRNSRRRRSNDVEWLDLQPDFASNSVTNAVLAIHEPMPSFMVLCFSKLLKLPSTRSLEQSITCLPTDFLAGLGFHPARTYALPEEPPSIVFTYRKFDDPPQWPITPAPDLNTMLSQLSQLTNLRLGCRKNDSSILTIIPKGIKTLDIAFTDPDPSKVAVNLIKMRLRCDKLVTLTIAVSPLHDEPSPEGDETMEVTDQPEAEVDFWEPFWKALQAIEITGVRIWEGEGARFRKFTRQIATPPVNPQSLVVQML